MHSGPDIGKERNIPSSAALPLALYNANPFSSEPTLSLTSYHDWQGGLYFTADWQDKYTLLCTIPNSNLASLLYNSQWRQGFLFNLATSSNLTATTPSESSQDLEIKNSYNRDNSSCETPQTSLTLHDGVNFELLPDELNQCEPSQHKSVASENCSRYASLCLSHK